MCDVSCVIIYSNPNLCINLCGRIEGRCPKCLVIPKKPSSTATSAVGDCIYPQGAQLVTGIDETSSCTHIVMPPKTVMSRILWVVAMKNCCVRVTRGAGVVLTECPPRLKKCVFASEALCCTFLREWCQMRSICCATVLFSRNNDVYP